MPEKPERIEKTLHACLQKAYGLDMDHIALLPLGADQHSTLYQAADRNKKQYFIKIRAGEINKAMVLVPEYLYNSGFKQVIPPVKTKSGQLWADLDSNKVILFPFLQGKNGFERKMPEKSWIAFGETLKTFHQVAWPSNITREIRHEAFSPEWRKRLTSHLDLMDEYKIEDPIAMELVAFLKSKRDQTLEFVTRAELLSSILVSDPPGFILCHGDIHGWNLFIDVNGSLYIVDWDTLIFAPRERDLMFIGAGLGDSGYTSQEEIAMFYQGYGHTEINNIAITYYRYERIIEDLAILSKQIFSLDREWRFRKQALEVLKSNYLPNNTIDAAHRSYKLIE